MRVPTVTQDGGPPADPEDGTFADPEDGTFVWPPTVVRSGRAVTDAEFGGGVTGAVGEAPVGPTVPPSAEEVAGTGGTPLPLVGPVVPLGASVAPPPAAAPEETCALPPIVDEHPAARTAAVASPAINAERRRDLIGPPRSRAHPIDATLGWAGARPIPRIRDLHARRSR
jgi:hypothetical protein